MIVVRIHGGLGNQMFQYALGRHLSLVTGQHLRLATGMYNPNPLGKFDLDKFHIAGRIASRLECSLLWRPAARLLPCVGERLGLPRGLMRVYRQPQSMEVDREVLGIAGSAYLVGEWQREEYFAGSADTIRNDFTLKKPPDSINACRLREIAEAQSVAVHVRRGDYVHDARTASEYNVCDLDYYRRAYAGIAASVREPRYFAFSDEPGWCRENLRFIPNLTVIDNNTEQRHEDLRLMAACKHFIIANSSFSWWGAWLGTDPSKVVVAPLRWSVSNWFDVRKWIPAGWQLV